MMSLVKLLSIGCLLIKVVCTVFQTSMGNNFQTFGMNDSLSGFQLDENQLDAPLKLVMENKHNNASSESGDAISGSSVLLNLVSEPVYIADVRAFRNQAYSREGESIISGNRFSATTNSDENITFQGDATRNSVKSVNESQAVAGNQISVKTLLAGSLTTDTVSSQNDAETTLGTTAISGVQTNLGGVFLTDVSIKDSAIRNTANAINQGNQSSIVSGIQTNVKNQVMSNVTAERDAKHNTASGESGTLVAGVQTNMMNMVNGNLSLQTYAGYNDVQTGHNSTAVAGIQFNSFVNSAYTTLNNTARDNKVSGIGHPDRASVAGVQVNQRDMGSSHFNSTSVSRDNEVDVQQGLAIAGVQNNLREIGEFQNGGTQVVTMDNTASDNFATTANNSVAGVQNNILLVNMGNIAIKSNATDNNATSVEGTSVSGVQNNLGFVAESNLTFENYAGSNVAYASGWRKTAVAGTQTNMYNVSDSNVTISNIARYNEATSLLGNAVAGAQVNIGHAINGSNVVVQNEVERNLAFTNSSFDAVVESSTNVGYQSADSIVSTTNV
eukprot:TRINITY_DN3238_c0_g1_i2.p1 TRINITY_DN3238_c0_g1~~TRINITY_DN3238_c0_g1_i2.p1  ORF type:complete len:555 (-),score=60.65 TRINITY_DN3238_c0_g1_i2:483-2147(-)